MLENKTCLKKFDKYTTIYRQDTHDYTDIDILCEVQDWSFILTYEMNFIPSYQITRVYISNRMGSTIACTGRNKDDRNTGYIKVNANFLKYHDDPDKLHSTLCHEAIHTLEGCFDHKQQFKKVGQQIMNVYRNLQISRTIGDSGYNAYRREQTQERLKWHVICQDCGQVIKRQRACDITKNPKRYKCGKCGGRFKVFKMEPDGLMTEYITLSI